MGGRLGVKEHMNPPWDPYEIWRTRVRSTQNHDDPSEPPNADPTDPPNWRTITRTPERAGNRWRWVRAVAWLALLLAIILGLSSPDLKFTPNNSRVRSNDGMPPQYAGRPPTAGSSDHRTTRILAPPAILTTRSG